MATSFVTLFCVGWTALVLMFDGMMARNIWMQHASSHYPSTEGRMTISELTTTHTSKGGTSYHWRLQYQYALDGRSYTNRQYRFGMTPSGYSWVSGMVHDHPKGSTVPVYYNPSEPSEALLSPNLEGADLMMTLFLTPFNLVMIGILTAGVARWKGRLLHAEAGGVRLLVDGPRTRARMPAYGSLVLGMVTMGVLSFVSVFIVGISTGMRPSIGTVLLIWAFVLVVSAGVYLWQWRKIHSGIDDLVLDETSGAIQLPATCGRKAQVTVFRSEITRVYVQKVIHTSSKGTVSYTYAPTLQWRRDAQFGEEKLADWLNEDRANAFTEWLGRKLNVGVESKVGSIGSIKV